MNADKLSPAEMEAYVRSRWECVFVHERTGSYSVLFGSPMQLRGGNTASTNIADPWRIAYSLTLQREREIAEVEEEIELVQKAVDAWKDRIGNIHSSFSDETSTKKFNAWTRILKSREAALSDLTHGWKGTK